MADEGFRKNNGSLGAVWPSSLMWSLRGGIRRCVSIVSTCVVLALLRGLIVDGFGPRWRRGYIHVVAAYAYYFSGVGFQGSHSGSSSRYPCTSSSTYSYVRR